MISKETIIGYGFNHVTEKAADEILDKEQYVEFVKKAKKLELKNEIILKSGIFQHNINPLILLFFYEGKDAQLLTLGLKDDISGIKKQVTISYPIDEEDKKDQNVPFIKHIIKEYLRTYLSRTWGQMSSETPNESMG